MKPIASKANSYYYNPDLQDFAKVNKKNMTKSAACMWKYVLRKRQMRGYRFRRERPILNYIADFACLALRLVIEVDGITHWEDGQEEKDARRDDALAEVGFVTLRFSSYDVLNQIKRVQDAIEDWVIEREQELGLKPGDMD